MTLRIGLSAYPAMTTSHHQVLGDQMWSGFEPDFFIYLFLYSIIQQLFSASLPLSYGSENKDD